MAKKKKELKQRQNLFSVIGIAPVKIVEMMTHLIEI